VRDVKRISSADNNQFKALLRLAHSSRERRKQGLSLLDGVHLVAAYRENAGNAQQIAISESGFDNTEIRAIVGAMAPLSPLILSDALFNKLSSVDSPTGIIAAIKTPKPSAMPRSFDACVMLEDIQDPGNVGSILRSSAAAGIRQIFLSRNSVHAWSPRVLRAGMGAHFMLEIFEATDLSAIIETFDGRVIAMDARAKNAIFDADMTGKIALLFGNEGAGVSRALIDAATQVVAIPMPGKVDSLNVAAAAAVCLFERVRQQYAPTRSVHPAQRVRQS